MASTCEHGNDFYSYQTCLRTQTDGGTWILNITSYSRTTTKHQRVAFNDGYLKGICLDNVPKGTDAQGLRRIVSLPLGSVITAHAGEFIPSLKGFRAQKKNKD